MASSRSDFDGWMWAEACQLIGEAERLHRQFFRLSSSEPAAPVWEPPADVFEDEREMVIVVAMPGVDGERVSVHHESGALVVRGARPLPLGNSRHRVRQLEIPYGTFERRIRLPPGRLEIGPPELTQGCLVLRLRKLD
jgi:HSP20 family molecular chaperone IbpA